MFEKVNYIFKVNDCMFDKIPFEIILIEVYIIRWFEKKANLLLKQRKDASTIKT